MRTGRIKWFNSFENCGYIVLYDGTEVYFHSSCILNPAMADLLNPGCDVSFDLIETRTGPEAQNVDLIG